jgi:hypothetical protein
MRKKDELNRSHTCMNTAHNDEMVFVLLGRDATAPVAIRAWIAERLRLGKNAETDEQIVTALDCASTMEAEGRKWADAQLAACDGVTRGLIVRPCEMPRGHDGPHRLLGDFTSPDDLFGG